MTDNLRSKNSFDFESSDNKFPYSVPNEFPASGGIPIGYRKFTLFKYSTEYFRKKKSSNNNLALIDGGNIPSIAEGMVESITVEIGVPPEELGLASEPETFVCSLLSGNAKKVIDMPENSLPIAINLSPNELIQVPLLCDENAIGGNEILYEKGKQQKPNTIYFPTFQASASKHPRALGFAHEDPYTCLKKNKEGGGVKANGTSFCCQEFCQCLPQSARVYTLVDVYGSDPLRKEFVPVSTLNINGFCCQDYPNINLPLAGSSWEQHCQNSNPCSFGFHIGGEITTMAGLCPPPDDETFVADSALVIRYDGGGNTNCGCISGGAKGKVSIGGVTKCVHCLFYKFDPNTGEPTDSFSTDECTTSNAGHDVCSCIFNETFKIGDTVYYFSTTDWPTNKFPNGQSIQINGGTVSPKGCGDQYIWDCNYLN